MQDDRGSVRVETNFASSPKRICTGVRFARMHTTARLASLRQHFVDHGPFKANRFSIAASDRSCVRDVRINAISPPAKEMTGEILAAGATPFVMLFGTHAMPNPNPIRSRMHGAPFLGGVGLQRRVRGTKVGSNRGWEGGWVGRVGVIAAATGTQA